MVLRRSWPVLGGLLALLAAQPLAAAGTLEQVRQRGQLQCGIAPGAPSMWVDAAGRQRGFDYDLCRAIAAAVLGDAGAIAITELTGSNRFEALGSGAVDVLLAQATWTFDREVGRHLRFTGVSFFDGQGFLGYIEDGTSPLFERRGLTVCAVEGTTSVQTLKEAIDARHLDWNLILYKTDEGRLTGFRNRHCRVMTDDRSALAAMRNRGLGSQTQLLPEILADEPLSPAVRDDDPVWFRVVRWSVLATIAGEQKNLGSRTVEERRRRGDGDPEERRLLGLDANAGKALGLNGDWAFQILRQVGNYAEIYDRAMAAEAVGRVPRGPNALIRDGGMLFAPGLR